MTWQSQAFSFPHSQQFQKWDLFNLLWIQFRMNTSFANSLIPPRAHLPFSHPPPYLGRGNMLSFQPTRFGLLSIFWGFSLQNWHSKTLENPEHFLCCPLPNYSYNLQHVLLMQEKTSPLPQFPLFTKASKWPFYHRWFFPLRKGGFFIPASGTLTLLSSTSSLCTHDPILLFLTGQTGELYLQCSLRSNLVFDQFPTVSPFNPLRCFENQGIQFSMPVMFICLILRAVSPWD